MSKIIVRGGRRLTGTVRVHGSKNAVLPIIAGALLATEGTTELYDVPRLDDVQTMAAVLRSLGATVEWRGDSLTIQAATLSGRAAEADLLRKMRASVLIMGPLLARFGFAHVALPGGCAIGSRPIDQHLKGFEALGAEIQYQEDGVQASLPAGSKRLIGARIYLDVASVGATENIMMAAATAEGVTFIDNAAREPEIVDLANFINAMGGNVRGAGTATIRIEGVECLRAVQHTVIPDRIEAGTYLIAGAITGGHVFVEGAISDHLNPLIAKLREMGVTVTEHENGLEVEVRKPLQPADIKTLPYPGFPTDLQAQMMALLTTVPGTSVITETVFENRFMHVAELQHFHAHITIDGRQAIIHGHSALKPAVVRATDLRAGAALVLTALATAGQSEIHGLHHIDRGYADFEQKLRHLGAGIERQLVRTPEQTAPSSPITS